MIKKRFWLPLLCAFFIGVGVVCAHVIPLFGQIVASWGSNEIMAAITIAGVLVALLEPVIEAVIDEQLYKKKLEVVYRIDIGITVLPNNFVRFSASIENVGDKAIETNVSNLYIDQGIEIKLTNDRDTNKALGTQYQFPFILEHKSNSADGRPDCVVCKKCFRENVMIYPEEIVGEEIQGKPELLRSHIKLKHLSKESVQYIKPREKFSEDVIVQFHREGVYRATLFVGCNGVADCECATKQFYIEKSLENISPSESIADQQQGGQYQ